MEAKIFVPITDQLMYDFPDLISGAIRPYASSLPCFRWEATIETNSGQIVSRMDSAGNSKQVASESRSIKSMDALRQAYYSQVSISA